MRGLGRGVKRILLQAVFFIVSVCIYNTYYIGDNNLISVKVCKHIILLCLHVVGHYQVVLKQGFVLSHFIEVQFSQRSQ